MKRGKRKCEELEERKPDDSRGEEARAPQVGRKKSSLVTWLLSPPGHANIIEKLRVALLGVDCDQGQNFFLDYPQ